MVVVEDVSIRSEQESLKSMPEVLAAFRKTNDTNELAALLMVAAQLYADASCRCEEKSALLGNTADDTIACNQSVRMAQQDMFEAFRAMVQSLKGG